MTASALALRIALLLGASLLVSVLRRRVGGGVWRNLVMFAGTVGGLAVGLLVSYPVSRAIEGRAFDVVDLCLVAGVLAGWAAAWPVARRFPPRRSD